jgi:hypothetical protein
MQLNAVAGVEFKDSKILKLRLVKSARRCRCLAKSMAQVLFASGSMWLHLLARRHAALPSLQHQWRKQHVLFFA